MGLITTRSLILQTYRYSDTSKILRLMTRERGPCSAVARGALRPRSRFGGLLEPFCEGQATLYFKEGRELHTLSEFDLLHERRAIGTDLSAYAAASTLCEIVLRLAPEHPDLILYETLDRGLEALAAPPAGANPGWLGLKHVWALVATLGFHPELDRCASCGRTIDEEPARFDYAQGGLRCRRCAAPGSLAEVREIAALRSLVSGAEGDIVGPQGRWLADFIRYHVSEGARLRSLPFLERIP